MALSLGHLASLYNYDMEEYEKAEQLYLRSIAIGEFKIPHKSSKDCLLYEFFTVVVAVHM